MDPEAMGGKPCILGMRVTVGMIVETLGFAAQLAQCHDVELAVQ